MASDPPDGEFLLDVDWGAEGLIRLAATHPVIVVVDVLRFSTAVSVAVGRGAHVLPYVWDLDGARRYADEQGAELAGNREDPRARWSLSPTDLAGIPAGTRLVLPSPNGATLSRLAVESGAKLLIAGCLRNARAVGRRLAAESTGRPVAVVAAGERWSDSTGATTNGTLRAAVEDLVGAGAIVTRTADALGLDRTRLSPEARAARAAFLDAADTLPRLLTECRSGQELAAWGWYDDLVTAAELDVDTVVPVFDGTAFNAA